MIRLRHPRVIALGVLLSACSASVEGDVYLRMENGETSRGTGLPVMLLKDDSVLAATRERACSTFWGTTKTLRDSFDILEPAQRDSTDMAFRDFLRNRTGATEARYDSFKARFEGTRNQRSIRDIQVRYDMFGVIDSAISRASTGTMDTGIDARYHFQGLSAGNYVIFAIWNIGSNKYRFWAPVTLAAGRTLKLDLNNSVEAAKELYCGVHR